MVYQNQTDADKGLAITDLLWWVTHGGQQYASPNYVALPANIVTRDEAKIKGIQCGSAACFKGDPTK